MAELTGANSLISSDISSRVLGRPPWFTYETDPSGRVYTRCLAHNAPILVITPGIPDFSSKELLADEKTNLENLMSDLQKFNEVNDGGDDYTSDKQNVNSTAKNLNDRINYAMDNMLANMKDNRYYRFNPATKEYLYILNSMVTRMNTRLATENYTTTPISITGKDSWYGINIFCTNKTTISESASNGYGDSMLESVQKTVGDKFRELSFVTDAMFSDDKAKADTAIQNASTMDSLMGGLMKGAASTIRGEKLMLPKIWKESSFSKSYSLDFDFYSPYGDIPSIFEHVFKPYLALLALALPRQTGLSSYKSPFLVRIESPGWFNIECGVIESITINRAPDPEDWSKDGLCKRIKISMSVSDIYPSLMLSYNTVALANNIGMAEYLDSLAGINVDDAKMVNIKRALNDTISGVLGAKDSYIDANLQRAKEILSKVSLGTVIWK